MSSFRTSFVYEGKRYHLRANSEKELIEKKAIKLHELSSGNMLINNNVNISRWIDEWFSTYKETTVSYSWQKELITMSNALKAHFGHDRKLSSIKIIELQRYLNSYSEKADATIKKHYTLIRDIFSKAYINDVISNDISKSLTLPKGKPARIRRGITDAERTHLIKVLESHRGKVFIYISLYSGLRPGEVTALQWCDIDLVNKIISVNKSRKKDGTVGKPKSSAGIRKIPISDKLFPILHAAHEGHGPFDLVCTQESGKPHTQTTIKNMWNNIRREINISMGCKVFRNQLIAPFPLQEGFELYSLRHTFCTDLQKAGIPIDIARRLMGHSSIELTSKIYTHYSEDVLENARNLINSLSSTSQRDIKTVPSIKFNK